MVKFMPSQIENHSDQKSLFLLYETFRTEGEIGKTDIRN
jgi:hypothetical protein